MYGYEIVKELEKRSANDFPVKEGTLVSGTSQA